MAKTKISEFSSTPANNTDIDSINIAEGCAPSNINDAIRELMAQLKDFQIGSQGDSFNGPIGSSTASTGAFTNITASGTLGVTGVATLGAGAILNTPASVTLTNATGLPISTGVSGLGTGVATALAVNVGSAGAPVVNGGALGTPSSGTATNLTGLPLSTGVTGTLPTTNGGTGLTSFTANGVLYASSTSALTSGSALTYNGTGLGVAVASADRVLSVYTADATGKMALFQNGNTNTNLYLSSDPSSGGGVINVSNNAASAALPLIFQGNGAEQMRLTSTGLGIGTSAPLARLTVSDSSNPASGTMTLGNNASFNGTLEYLIGPGELRISQVGSSSLGTTFYTNGAERMRLDSAGNLGLGVTPSAWNSSQWSVFEGAYGGALAFYKASNVPVTVLTSNAYNDGGWKYKTTDPALQYEMDGNVGIHKWYTAASGTAGDAISFTQAMTLDASGNLGVGTTSPSARFHSYAGATSQAGIFEANNSVALLSFASNTTSSYTRVQLGAAGNDMVLYTTGTERARIDSSGNLLVGRTSAIASERLSVEGSNTSFISRIRNTSATTPSGVFVSYTAAAPNDTGNSFFRADDNAATRAEIRSNGGIANYSANNVNLSDVRTKTDIQNAGGYLAKICAIPVRTFKYKDQTDDLLNLGVIAQEVEAVAPEFVDTTGFGELPEDGVPLKAIYQTDLQYALMKALQELKAEFDAYKASHP